MREGARKLVDRSARGLVNVKFEGRGLGEVGQGAMKGVEKGVI